MEYNEASDQPEISLLTQLQQKAIPVHELESIYNENYLNYSLSERTALNAYTLNLMKNNQVVHYDEIGIRDSFLL